MCSSDLSAIQCLGILELPSSIKVYYGDMHMWRAECIRLTLYVGDVPFEDVRDQSRADLAAAGKLDSSAVVSGDVSRSRKEAREAMERKRTNEQEAMEASKAKLKELKAIFARLQSAQGKLETVKDTSGSLGGELAIGGALDGGGELSSRCWRATCASSTESRKTSSVCWQNSKLLAVMCTRPSSRTRKVSASRAGS